MPSLDQCVDRQVGQDTSNRFTFFMAVTIASFDCSNTFSISLVHLSLMFIFNKSLNVFAIEKAYEFLLMRPKYAFTPEIFFDVGDE